MQSAALFLFLAFGIAASVSDIATRRVSNRLISMAFLSILVGYAFLLIETLLGSHKIVWMGLGERYLSYSFYRGVVINLLLCAISAVVLWRRRIWPAGDAKFFVAASLFLPLIRVDIPGFPYWIFFKLLINTFIPAAVFIVLRLLILKLYELRGAENRIPSYQKILQAIRKKINEFEWPTKEKRYTIAFIWNMLILSSIPMLLLGHVPNRFQGLLRLLFYIALYSLFKWMRSLLWKIDIGIILGIGIIIASVRYHQPIFLDILRGVAYGIGFMIFFTGFRVFMLKIDLGQSVERTVGGLEPGDVLADTSWQKLIELCSRLNESWTLTRYADGLSREDISAIHHLCATELDQTLQVFKTRPFAFWIFLGALWTLYTHEIVLRWPLALMGIH